MKIVVIVPTYNEKENIVKMLTMLEEEVFPEVKQHEMAILVADDRSPDGTADEVRNLIASEKWKNITLIEGEKEGLGAAYARAMKFAMNAMQAGAVIELDSDFQHDPKDIPRLIKAMDDGADYVIGSRYIPGGAIPREWEFHRKFISFVGGSLFGRLMLWRWDIHDITSGYKLTKTEHLRNVDLDNLLSKYYAYKIHILHDIVAQNVKVKEVPIVFYERKKGTSKITQKDLFDSFYVVIRLRLEDSKRIVKFLMVGGTGFLIQLLTQEFSARVLQLPQSVAVGLGAESAILSNFMFNHFWTFKDTKRVKENKGFFRKLVKFNMSSFFSIFLQVATVWLVTQILGNTIYFPWFSIKTRILVLFPTIILLVIPLNYLIYNKIIWKTQYLKDGKTA